MIPSGAIQCMGMAAFSTKSRTSAGSGWEWARILNTLLEEDEAWPTFEALDRTGVIVFSAPGMREPEAGWHHQGPVFLSGNSDFSAGTLGKTKGMPQSTC